MTSTESTSGSAASTRSASPNTSGAVPLDRSIGLAEREPPGTSASSALRVTSDGSASTRPAPSSASVARNAGPHELVSTATRGPAGSAWRVSTLAVWNIWVNVSTRITPDWSSIAPTEASDGQPDGSAHVLPHAPADLHGHDRLGPRHLAGDAAELARVAERLQVQEDDVGVGVVLPVAQEVVAGHVGLVADGDERRDAQAPRPQLLDDGGADRARLGGQADAAGQRIDVGERGVQPDLGRRVDDAEAVRPDEPHPVPAGQRDQVVLEALAGVVLVGEARRDDDQPLHPPHRALLDDAHHLVGRHADHGQVQLAGDVEHRVPGPHARHVVRARVDRVHGPLEPAAHQVVEHLVADRALAARRTDDRHRVGPQEALDRSSLGAPSAVVDGGEGLGGRVDRQLDLDDPLLEPAVRLEARRG